MDNQYSVKTGHDLLNNISLSKLNCKMYKKYEQLINNTFNKAGASELVPR